MTADDVSLNSFLVNYKVGATMINVHGLTLDHLLGRIVIGITAV
jgi:hypothetical protein